MTSKIGILIISLTISSIINLPIERTIYNDENKLPSYSFLTDPIVPSFSSSSSSGTSSSSNNMGDYFYCPPYGPFPLDNCSNFDATFTYKLYNIPSTSIIERIRLLNSSNSVVASSSKTSFTYTLGQKKTVTFTIPIKDYWSVNGLTLKFEILNSVDRSIMKAYSTTFYPPSKKTILGATLKRSIYTSKPLGFYADGIVMKSIIVIFDFTTIGDFINVDYYYRLNLHQNYFLYPSNDVLTASSVNLRFNDDDNLFPYFTHEDNGDIILPLSLIKNGSEVSFKPKNTLYVNKRTLQMSDTYRSSFASTKDFYLPINGRKKFNNKQLYIDLTNLGKDQISTSIPLKYDVDQSLVGVCTDGGYCLIGGNR